MLIFLLGYILQLITYGLMKNFFFFLTGSKKDAASYKDGALDSMKYGITSCKLISLSESEIHL